MTGRVALTIVGLLYLWYYGLGFAHRLIRAMRTAVRHRPYVERLNILEDTCLSS